MKGLSFYFNAKVIIKKVWYFGGIDLVHSREQAQAIVMALKNGVVPHDISSIETGRKEEFQELENTLNIVSSGNGLVKFVGGEYGSGKSFLLKAFQQKALDQNFVVANIQIDKGLRFNNFHALYYHILHNLMIKDFPHQKTSFKDLFNRWIVNLQLSDNKEDSAAAINQVITDLNQYNISFSRALLFYLRARIQKDQELANVVASWLSGEKNIPYFLKKKFEIVGDIDKTNAIDFLKSFIRLIKWLGYKGLVILVDELELVMNERSDIRQAAYENLRYIVDNSFNGHFNHSLFLFAATKEWFQHQEKGPKTYPPLSQRIGKWSDKKHFVQSNPILILSRPNTDDFQEITIKIVKIYIFAYEFDLKISEDSLHNWVTLLLQQDGVKSEDINMRIYSMKLIEFLDLMKSNPNSRGFHSELKSVSYNGKLQFIQTLNN